MIEKKQFQELKKGDKIYTISSRGNIKTLEVSEAKYTKSQNPFAAPEDKELILVITNESGEYRHLIMANVGERHIVEKDETFYYSDLTAIGDFLDYLVGDFTKLVTGKKHWYQEDEV
jgi:hypothetical protein